jgi:hypothetical protein
MRRVSAILLLSATLVGWSVDQPAPVTPVTPPSDSFVTTTSATVVEPPLKQPSAELRYDEVKETPSTTTNSALPTPPSEEDIGKIIWQEFSADNTWEIPFATSLDNLTDYPERKTDWDDFLEKLIAWTPGHVTKVEDRVRNLLCVCVLEDIGQGQFEAELPLHMYKFLCKEIPKQQLKDLLGIMSFYPDYGTVISTAPELNLDIGVGESQVRQRLQILAVKMLGRELGKLPLGVSQETPASEPAAK